MRSSPGLLNQQLLGAMLTAISRVESISNDQVYSARLDAAQREHDSAVHVKQLYLKQFKSLLRSNGDRSIA